MKPWLCDKQTRRQFQDTISYKHDCMEVLGKINSNDHTRSFSAASQILSTLASDKPLIPVRLCQMICKNRTILILWLEYSCKIEQYYPMFRILNKQCHKQDINLARHATKNSDSFNEDLGCTSEPSWYASLGHCKYKFLHPAAS